MSGEATIILLLRAGRIINTSMILRVVTTALEAIIQLVVLVA